MILELTEVDLHPLHACDGQASGQACEVVEVTSSSVCRVVKALTIDVEFAVDSRSDRIIVTEEKRASRAAEDSAS